MCVCVQEGEESVVDPKKLLKLKVMKIAEDTFWETLPYDLNCVSPPHYARIFKVLKDIVWKMEVSLNKIQPCVKKNGDCK